jgi:hypothetical protein
MILGEAKYSIYPTLGMALLGLIIVLAPALYNRVNSAANPDREPVTSPWPARLIGLGLMLLALFTWLKHRGEFY